MENTKIGTLFNIIINLNEHTPKIINELFGDKLNNNESLFLSRNIKRHNDDKFANLLDDLADAINLKSPKTYTIQVFNRKAGFTFKEYDSNFGSHCMALCLCNPQLIRYDGQEHYINAYDMSPIFELKPNQGNSKEPRPTVPKNKTMFNFKNKIFLKSRKYSSYLIWLYWDEDPKIVRTT